MGRRLRALEQAVGQTLFQRTSDGFVLTDEGAAMLAHAERMEEEALAFERRLAGQDPELEGMLRLSSSDWFGVAHAGAGPGRILPRAAPGRGGAADRRQALQPAPA